MSTAMLYEFRADIDRREITGLVLPWNTPGINSEGTWIFRRGSLTWPADVSRVKLLRDHDPFNAVGVTLSLDDRADGLHGRFRIARGTAGDETLKLVEDGVLDGLSVGPRIRSDGFTERRDGTRVVTRGEVVEVTLTSFPAMRDARVKFHAAHPGTMLFEDLSPSGYHASEPLRMSLPPGTETDDRWNVRVRPRAAGEPRTRSWMGTDRETGKTIIKREAVADPVPGAVTTARIHHLHGKSIEPPDDFTADERERFWELIKNGR